MLEDDVPVRWVDELPVPDFEIGGLHVEEEMCPVLVCCGDFEHNLALEIGLVRLNLSGIQL